MSDIVRKQSPEEAELENKQAELAALEQELTELELELATLLSQWGDGVSCDPKPSYDCLQLSNLNS